MQVIADAVEAHSTRSTPLHSDSTSGAPQSPSRSTRERESPPLGGDPRGGVDRAAPDPSENDQGPSGACARCGLPIAGPHDCQPAEEAS
jgi:hypothetical protein